MKTTSSSPQNKRTEKTEPLIVKVFVESSTSWGRDVIKGIDRYFRAQKNWQLQLNFDDLDGYKGLRAPAACDGAIARISSNTFNEQLKSAGLPVVNVSGIALKNNYFPRICTDLDKGAAMVARYLSEKGFRNYGYFSYVNPPFVQTQQVAFAHHVKTLGGTFSWMGFSSAERKSDSGNKRLIAWLKQKEKPFALLTWNAQSAQIALQSCLAAGLRVPEEVAIISGTDDDLLCEVSHIPITGVQNSCEEIGYKAAEHLNLLMAKKGSATKLEYIAPVRIVSRLSTAVLAINDLHLTKALEFIREKARDPISVDDVARSAGLSRRMLERRFVAVLKRTPAEQIRHVRFLKAEELLTKTNLSIPAVAEASGFGSPEYMAYVFRQSNRGTPLQYRKKYHSFVFSD